MGHMRPIDVMPGLGESIKIAPIRILPGVRKAGMGLAVPARQFHDGTMFPKAMSCLAGERDMMDWPPDDPTNAVGLRQTFMMWVGSNNDVSTD